MQVEPAPKLLRIALRANGNASRVKPSSQNRASLDTKQSLEDLWRKGIMGAERQPSYVWISLVPAPMVYAGVMGYVPAGLEMVAVVL